MAMKGGSAVSELDNYTEEEKQKAVQRILHKKEYDRQHYQEHKGEKVGYYRQHYQEHKDGQVEYNRQYYQKCKARIVEHNRQYQREHKAKRAEHDLQYQREHPEVLAAASARRRVRMANFDGNFTSKEFRALCVTFENRCVYCGQELPLGPDHLVPLSRGGSNSIDNIVPCCRYCNSAKHTKTYEEYVEQLRLGDEGRDV